MSKVDNNNIKIKYTNKNGAGKYIISYTSKGMKLGRNLLRNILKQSSAIVNLDTSLSFMDNKAISEFITKLKATLKSLDVNFYNRTITPAKFETNGLVHFLLYGKTAILDREIITFELNKDFSNNELFALLSDHGCEIFVAESPSVEIIQDVFNCNYQDIGERLASFKYVIYVNDSIGQAALNTKTLNEKDVEALCR